MPTDAPVDLRVLILAPIGRDGALTSQLLSNAGVPCHVCADARELCREIRRGAGAVLLTEEALADPGIDELAATLQTQPAWSDVSLLLFAGDDRSQATIRTPASRTKVGAYSKCRRKSAGFIHVFGLPLIFV